MTRTFALLLAALALTGCSKSEIREFGTSIRAQAERAGDRAELARATTPAIDYGGGGYIRPTPEKAADAPDGAAADGGAPKADAPAPAPAAPPTIVFYSPSK